MIVQRNNITANIDWISIILWLVMMGFGWMNIYSANTLEESSGAFDFSQRYGKQLIWIGAALILAVLVFILDAKFYIHFSYILYAFLILVLIGVLLFGREINGAKSWFVIGGFQIQPSEFAKPVTALALASLMTSHSFNLKKFTHLLQAGVIILLPALLIMLQPDLGSTVVYFAFVFVLFREGFSANVMIMLAGLILLFFATLVIQKPLVLLIIAGISLLVYLGTKKSVKKTVVLAVAAGALFGILHTVNRHLLDDRFSLFWVGLATMVPIALFLAVILLRNRDYRSLKIIAGLCIAILFVISVDHGMNRVLKPHQQQRIYVTLGLEDDPQGVGYNVNQSKIAIGSGGFSGKGYLNGTQTKLHFVPEQSTDFIFCTVGEEWGFLGTTFVILIYAGFLLRMIVLAERQRSAFSRIFGYGFISVLFIHFMINIGMTIGLMPVIGIPLPFFSYGGSSLWAFTAFLCIFLRLDASRLELLR
ncbi:MAG TPA: rod shape-determining protein RodA [Bacteroides sp.]|nr:rod shape-determining protein RodA [Bacteroides sp.]